MVRRKALSTIFLVACTWGLQAQEQLPVDIDDPVYPILEMADIRGLVGPGSAVKPYSEKEVRSRLEAITESERLVVPEEQAVVEEMSKRFPKGDAPPAYVETEGESSLRSDVSEAWVVDFSLMGEIGILGSLWSVGGYRLQLEGFLDMLNPDAYPPFDFTKQYDGFQVWTNGGSVQNSDGINGHLNFSSAALSALSFDFFDDELNIQLSRARRDWGVGEGSLSLSGTARPIEAFVASAHPVSWGSYSFLAGTLGYWWSSAAEQKMFSIHRIELFPFDWLYLSPWESVVYAKRLELSYLNPLFPFFFGQQLNGDIDNLAAGADVAVTIAPFARVYASLFIDEISFPPLSTFFTRPENRYAWQVGVKVPVPWLSWSLFVFQYTKIEPYTYTHYPQTVPDYTTPIDINYTNDNENIGYHLPPNSDEFLVRLLSYPFRWLQAAVQYQLIRHGTGNHLLGQIEGGINTPIIVTPPTTYPMKDFLNDGIYEWIHIARIDLACFLPILNATVWAEYAFVYATNYTNIVGNDVVKNVIGFGVKVRFATWAGGG